MTLRAPSDCHDMTSLRQQIDLLDRRLVDLLELRSQYIDRATQIKEAAGLPARIDARVEEVVGKVRSAAAGRGLDEDLVETLWRELIEWSIARENTVLGS